MAESIRELFELHCGDSPGFPHPNWPAIEDWCKKHVPESGWHDFYSEIAAMWLDRMAARLGSDYTRFESERFILVTARPEPDALRMLRFCEEKLTRVLEIFPGITSVEGSGKHAVVHFRDGRAYWEYLSDFHPDGEWADSAGALLSHGYDHIVLVAEEDAEAEVILLHELMHNCLVHLALPLWLDEGLARVAEIHCKLASPLLLDAETTEKHRNHWDGDSIQDFWCGAAFHHPEHSQLAYELAEILMVLIGEVVQGRSEVFAAFVNEARAGDAGETSAQLHLGRGLGEIAARFLGPGDWTPAPNLSE